MADPLEVPLYIEGDALVILAELAEAIDAVHKHQEAGMQDEVITGLCDVAALKWAVKVLESQRG